MRKIFFVCYLYARSFRQSGVEYEDESPLSFVAEKFHYKNSRFFKITIENIFSVLLLRSSNCMARSFAIFLICLRLRLASVILWESRTFSAKEM